ncbi:ribosome maturation factor RimP [Pseudochrobactrum algeriensis]|uniref:ribosome maturation factor RimP n=1 Tax=Pseudochrobactrum algeriensis TaxID=2834768 RepID=UPI001BCDC654|nr:ribosome maturation factor RimP [Pseudochrobactrum algeriensis]MBX8813861.1 ribosome maturation factor RimP [Ochrobactrum sp. MR34]QVQ36867.1 ribosome maturation factor RimP [Pseudochrobactrum algeriensis]QVQ40083.1 ribosome maturation factor RimP [Pseudochrobactrum algeriensis]QVQ44006.1 ribosome maturation factor RimP [Pseudochrobactrum algeriensis]
MNEQTQQDQNITALDATQDEPRIIRETGIDAKVASLIEPAINAAGFRLVRVRLSGLNGLTLQIMAERPDGTMTVEDCEIVSRTVSPVLDVEDPIDGKYHLEISSPGIDRPMVRKSDFSNWQGHIAKLETSMLHDNRKKFRGRIIKVEDETVTLEADQATYGAEAQTTIPFELIADARLILTDDLIRDALRKDKALREGRIPGDELSDEFNLDSGNADAPENDKDN